MAVPTRGQFKVMPRTDEYDAFTLRARRYQLVPNVHRRSMGTTYCNAWLLGDEIKTSLDSVI